MTGRHWIYTLVLLAFCGVNGTSADDLEGADRLLCTAVTAVECYADGECVEGQPETWNVPRFVRVDLDSMTLSTTEASGHDRSTPIQTVERSEDRLLIQGTDQGRAFSVVVNATTGLASTGIALDGNVLSIFSYCTPLGDGE